MITNNRLISTSNVGTVDELASLQTQQMLNLGRHNGWGFTVLGKADLPDRPIHLEKWLIVPAYEDKTPVPKRTLERIQTIYTAGLRPQGFVVVHEAPRLLSVPANQAPNPTDQTGDPLGSSSLYSLAAGLGTVLGIMAKLVFAVTLVGLVALDPIVIAVMDDGSWVEIDRWYV